MDDFDMMQSEEFFEDRWSDEDIFDTEEGIEF